jgi:hypothetical protein
MEYTITGQDKTLGQIAYEAYCHARQWKAFNGDTLLQWPEVLPEIQDAWEKSSEAVELELGRINHQHIKN